MYLLRGHGCLVCVFERRDVFPEALVGLVECEENDICFVTRGYTE